MPTYTYLAKKNLNESVEGIIVADTQDNAVDKLIEMGLSPIKVEPLVSEARKSASSRVTAGVLSAAGFSRRDLVVLTSQLKSLIRARVDLLKSLSILYGQADKAKLKDLILDLHSRVKNGVTFSEALAAHKDFFPSLYINLIRTGEASGRLDEVLEQLDRFLSKDEEFKMHVRTALAYPILMVTVGIGVIFVLFTYVIPKLAAIFSDFDYELPIPTKVLMGISGFFQSYWWAMLLGAAAFVVVLTQLYKTPAGRLQLDRIRLHLPVVGDLHLKQSLARFCNTLSLLMRSGLPVFQALEVATPTLENAVFIRELELVRKEVLEGGSLANSMKKAALFPSFLVQMVSVGEEGGKLEGVLSEIGSIYVAETDEKLKMITSLLEPVIILVLGLILGGIVLAMLLPIFQINMLIK